MLTCSSSEVLNALIDDLSRNIDENQGLKKLVIYGLKDMVNTLEDWPLSQLLLKSPHLEELVIGALYTTPANRSQLVEFIGSAATNSSCLRKLII